jgi:hypothetical protein
MQQAACLACTHFLPCTRSASARVKLIAVQLSAGARARTVLCQTRSMCPSRVSLSAHSHALATTLAVPALLLCCGSYSLASTCWCACTVAECGAHTCLAACWMLYQHCALYDIAGVALPVRPGRTRPQCLFLNICQPVSSCWLGVHGCFVPQADCCCVFC